MAELVRFSLQDSALVAGPGPGRGLWLCFQRSCLERAEKQPGRLRHALQLDEAPEVRAGLVSQARGALISRLEPALRHAHRGGLARPQPGPGDRVPPEQALMVWSPPSPPPADLHALMEAIGAHEEVHAVVLMDGRPGRRAAALLRLLDDLG